MNKKISISVAIIVLLLSVLVGYYYIPNDNSEGTIPRDEIVAVTDDGEELSDESDWDTMTADECYDDEYYDEEDKWCYANETTDESEDFTSDDIEHDFQDHGEHDDGLENLEAVYDIQGDTITLKSGTEDPTHAEIWSLYTKAIPSYFRENVKYFNVTNEPENDVDASVFRDSENFGDWHIHVNRVSYFDEETGELIPTKVHTLIHEFTHILTLGDDQIDEVDASFDDDQLAQFKLSCTTFYLDEGCLEKGSYLERFMTQFWPQEDIDFAAASGGAETFNQEGVESLYTERESDFVTEYAATSPTEDIAESFGFFILSPKPTGNTMADQKLLFFYNYPELVKVREVIRNRLK